VAHCPGVGHRVPPGEAGVGDQHLFDESEGTYGYRRVHAELERLGEHCTDELVRSIMRDLGLQPCQPRPRRRGLTAADAAAGPIQTWSAATSSPTCRG